MAEECNEDPAKPFAALSITTRSDQPNEEDLYQQYHHDQTKHFHSRTKLILCFGFIASLTLLFAFTFIVLSLTVFHLRNPDLTVESTSFIQPFDLLNTTRNATVSVQISLRNPNAASFRVRNVTLAFFRHMDDNKLVVLVGESIIITSDTIPAKRTVKMNLTAEIVTTKLLASVPSLMEDLNGKGLDLRSSVIVNGKVKIIKIFKKSVHLQKDCSIIIMNNSIKITFPCLRYDMHTNMSKSQQD